MINGRTVVGRLRQTGGEQSDSNKVNLPPIHLPQPISCLTARALHTLTNATPLGTRAQAAVVPHAAFFSWQGGKGGCSARARRRIKRRGKTHLFLMAPRHRAPPSHPPPIPSPAQSFISGDGCLRDQHYLIAFYGSLNQIVYRTHLA